MHGAEQSRQHLLYECSCSMCLQHAAAHGLFLWQAASVWAQPVNYCKLKLTLILLYDIFAIRVYDLQHLLACHISKSYIQSASWKFLSWWKFNESVVNIALEVTWYDILKQHWHIFHCSVYLHNKVKWEKSLNLYSVQLMGLPCYLFFYLMFILIKWLYLYLWLHSVIANHIPEITVKRLW